MKTEDVISWFKSWKRKQTEVVEEDKLWNDVRKRLQDEVERGMAMPAEDLNIFRREVVALLPKEELEALTMHAGGATYRTIAEKTGVTYKIAIKRLVRAYSRIRVAQLEKESVH